MIQSRIVTLALLAAAGAPALGGCNLGLNSVLFVTRTQMALDVDTEPPSMDIGYDRDEFVLAPVFEDGQVLPVLTTVGHDADLHFASDHSFATGDAAVVMADAFTRDQNYWELAAGVKHSDVPEPKRKAEAPEERPRSGVVRAPQEDLPEGFWANLGYSLWGSPKRKRYFFGTDTSFGLHVEWTGNNLPRSVSIGWKRKELAFVPLVEEPGPPADEGGAPQYTDIRLASLIATAEARTSVGGVEDTGARIGQTFATGDAATLLAADPDVREALGPSVVANYEQVKAIKEIREARARRLETQTAAVEDQRTLLKEIGDRYAAIADVAAKQQFLDAALEMRLIATPLSAGETDRNRFGRAVLDKLAADGLGNTPEGVRKLREFLTRVRGE